MSASDNKVFEGATLTFGDRMWMQHEFYEWAKQNDIGVSPMNVIAWLDIRGYIRPPLIGLDAILFCRERKLYVKVASGGVSELLSPDDAEERATKMGLSYQALTVSDRSLDKKEL
jgi:hypothetical protein